MGFMVIEKRETLEKIEIMAEQQQTGDHKGHAFPGRGDAVHLRRTAVPGHRSGAHVAQYGDCSS